MNIPEIPGATVVFWCSACCAAPGVTTIEAMLNDQWVPIQLCQECLTKFDLAGMMEE